jgi:DNA-damage-inducible protein D
MARGLETVFLLFLTNGTEYWCARELASVLEYSKWENFHKVIKRAMISCENSGRTILDQFPEVRNLVEGGGPF